MQLIEHLKNQLISIADLHGNQQLCIAYSGGLDSHVLLHLMSQLRAQNSEWSLRAVHVHHGLSPHADRWVEHCRTVCVDLNIDFHCEYLHESLPTGESVEAWARQARYAALEKSLTPGAILLTAHTQNDQAETVLLQLLRGAGPKGLAAMPQQQVFASGLLFRPLLNLTRQQLHEYALQQKFSWIEDESNADHRFDRNFLRHRIIPVLRERWPQLEKNISRSAQHCAEAISGLEDLARLDLSAKISEQIPQTLSIELLRTLSPARQRNLLRYWLSGLGCRLPNTRHMQRIQQDLVNSSVDSQPQVSWDHWIMRRHRQWLIVERKAATMNLTEFLPWDLSAPLELPHGLGRLVAVQQLNGGLSLNINPEQLTIRFRRGGERCRLAGKNQSTSLKKLFQEWDIPSWRRSTIPLLYYGDELAAIIGYGICAEFAAHQGERGWSIIEAQNWVL